MKRLAMVVRRPSSDAVDAHAYAEWLAQPGNLKSLVTEWLDYCVEVRDVPVETFARRMFEAGGGRAIKPLEGRAALDRLESRVGGLPGVRRVGGGGS